MLNNGPLPIITGHMNKDKNLDFMFTFILYTSRPSTVA